MADTPHQHFTVSSTAYLRNLDAEDRRRECIAVHYQDAPKRTERGTSIGLKFPFLIVAHYVEGQWQEAEKVARILNAHWNEAPDDTAFWRAECERLAEALQPFADQADAYDSCEQHPDGCPDEALCGDVVDLTVGQFRAARSALAAHAVRLIDGAA